MCKLKQWDYGFTVTTRRVTSKGTNASSSTLMIYRITGSSQWSDLAFSFVEHSTRRWGSTGDSRLTPWAESLVGEVPEWKRSGPADWSREMTHLINIKSGTPGSGTYSWYEGRPRGKLWRNQGEVGPQTGSHAGRLESYWHGKEWKSALSVPHDALPSFTQHAGGGGGESVKSVKKGWKIKWMMKG